MTKDHNPRRSDSSSLTAAKAVCPMTAGAKTTTSRTAIEILTGSAVIRVSNGTDPQLLSYVLHLMGDIR